MTSILRKSGSLFLAAFLLALGGIAAAPAQPVSDIVKALSAPTAPGRGVGPVYGLRQILADARIRARMPAIDLDQVEFRSGSAAITEKGQAQLASVATAIRFILSHRPFEVFLIEGHTDAPGSKAFNRKLSTRRAAAAASLLVGKFGIPARNIAFAGYGESELRVNTRRAEPKNRRITVRRITDLLDPIR